jgi:hypothetical protein
MARRISAVTTFAIVAAVVGFSYWFERTYTRWWKDKHLLAAPRVKFASMKSTYSARQADAADMGKLAIDVMNEIGRARS